MNKVILTSRLKLIKLDNVAEGSIEVEHAHIVRSSPEASIWSVRGACKSIDETRQLSESQLPMTDWEDEYDVRRFRASYLVYRRKSDSEGSPAALTNGEASDVLGSLGIRERQLYGAPMAEHLSVPGEKILTMEIGYAFLPTAWGQGYAAESIKGVLEAFRDARHWSPPFENIFIYAFIGEQNPRSIRTVEKAGFRRMGLHEWDGPDTFIGGAMMPPRGLVFGYGPFLEVEN